MTAPRLDTMHSLQAGLDTRPVPKDMLQTDTEVPPGKPTTLKKTVFRAHSTGAALFICLVLGILSYLSPNTHTQTRGRPPELTKHANTHTPLPSSGRERRSPEYGNQELKPTHARNVTLKNGVTSTVLIDVCLYVPCPPTPSAWAWYPVYMCYVTNNVETAYCSNWKQAVWFTDGNWQMANLLPTDFTRLRRRLSIKKINQHTTDILLTLETAVASDRGWFVICIYVPGKDPCGSIFLDIAPSPLPGLLNFTYENLHKVQQKNTLTETLTQLRPLLYPTDHQHHEEPNRETLTDNLWYNSIHMMIKRSDLNSNTSCYACTLFPTAHTHSVPVKPVPMTANEICCRFVKLTTNVPSKLKTNCIQSNHTQTTLTIRSYNSTSLYRETKNWRVFSPVGQIDERLLPTHTPFCFSRAGGPASRDVGSLSNCGVTYNATCSLSVTQEGHYFHNTKSPCLIPAVSDMAEANRLDSEFKGRLMWPSDDGFGATTDMVWLCASNYYQVLPPNWSGVCSPVFLVPHVEIYNELLYTTHQYPHYRAPTTPIGSLIRPERELMIAPDNKFIGGLLPWYGTVNNAHHIDRLHIELEKLAAYAVKGFDTLLPFEKAARMMILQNRMGLDLIYASESGLCHVIGEHCCSYIPDVSGNMSTIIDHMNSLLADMKQEDVPSPQGWNLWSWLTSGSWSIWLTRILVPVGTITLLLVIFSCCILPLMNKCVSHLIHGQLVQYQLIQMVETENPTYDPFHV